MAYLEKIIIDPKDQCEVGLMYLRGHGDVEQDNEAAMKWFRKSAEQGHAYSQYELGMMYYCGEGVEQDNEEAMKWFRKSAEQGHVVSQYNLGVMYVNGDGVDQDYKKAERWFHKAVDQGDEEAKEPYDKIRQFLLGEECYKNGNFEESKKHLSRAMGFEFIKEDVCILLQLIATTADRKE